MYSLISLMISIAIWALITGLPVMLLWDWLMPAIWGLPTITFVQALGISCLCGLLLKSK